MSYCGRCLTVLPTQRSTLTFARCPPPANLKKLTCRFTAYPGSLGIVSEHPPRADIDIATKERDEGVQNTTLTEDTDVESGSISEVPNAAQGHPSEIVPWRMVSGGPMAGRHRYRMNYTAPWNQKLPIDRMCLDSGPDVQSLEGASQINRALDRGGPMERMINRASVTSRISWRSLYRLHYTTVQQEADAQNALAAERRQLNSCQTPDHISTLGRALAADPTNARFHKIPRLLAAALTMSAHCTLPLLDVIPISKPELRFEIFMDALVYMARHHEQELDDSADLSLKFERHLKSAFTEWRWPLYRLQTRHLDLFLEKFSVEAINELLARDDDETIPEPKTVFALIDFYTRHHDTDAALDLLRYLPEEVLIASEPILLQRCTNLLKQDAIQNTNGVANFRILPQILELGIRPDAFIHAMIMKNTTGAGVSEVAWDLFDYLRREKLETPSAMYLILLQNSYRRQDVGRLNEVLTAIHERQDLASNPELITCTMNIVRIICTFKQRLSLKASLSRIFAIYDRAFNRRAMIKLGMFRGVHAAAPLSELPDPTPATLAYAIRSWVLVQQRPQAVDDVWHALVERIEAGDELYKDAAKHVVLFDGFVLFFCLSENTIEKGLAVVQYMLDIGFCEPTSRTWMNLIYGFQKYGRDEAAHKVCDLMVANGVFPTAKSWERIKRDFPDSELATYARKHFQRHSETTPSYTEGQSHEQTSMELEDVLEEHVSSDETRVSEGPNERQEELREYGPLAAKVSDCGTI